MSENYKPEYDELYPFAQEKVTILEKYRISPVLFAFLSLLFIFFLYQIIGGFITYAIFGLNVTEENIIGFRIATGVGQLLFIFIPTILLFRFVTFEPKQFLRLHLPNGITFLLPLVGIFSLQQMLQVYLELQELIPLPKSIQPHIQQIKELVAKMYKLLVTTNSPAELLFVILVVALIPAFVEELLFRGLVLRSFEKKFTPFMSVTLSGIVFGCYHLNPFTLIPLIVIGVYLGFLVYRADSLWVSVAAHFYNNAIACIAVYLNLGEDFIVFGDRSSNSIETLLLTFIVFSIVFTLTTIIYIQVTKKPKDIQKLI